MTRAAPTTQPRASALGELVSRARTHEQLPVPVPRQLCIVLWTAMLTAIPTAMVHHLVLREHTPAFAQAAVSLGGRWTLATALILASAATLAVLGILTHGFTQASKAHLFATSVAGTSTALAILPTVALCLAFAAAMVACIIMLFALIIGVIATAYTS